MTILRNEIKTTNVASSLKRSGASSLDAASPNKSIQEGEMEQEDEKIKPSAFCCRMSKQMTVIFVGCMSVSLGLGGAGAGFSQVNDDVYACGSQAPSQRDLD